MSQLWQSKRKVTERHEIHEGGANVYRDLGFPDAEDMLVKAQLVRKFSEIIRGTCPMGGRKGLRRMTHPSGVLCSRDHG